MMSLIDLDDDQRWVPTHVNVTVLRARGLRTKGKHGNRYLYTIIQVGKEKYTTGLVEKAEVPEWNEECCFELLPGILEEEGGGRSAYPPASGDLVLTVMHRVLIGLDVFLGQTIIPLNKIFQEGMCPRDEWFKLNSKVGRKEKERGELQVTVQFTRNNMTASMFDLTMKDKPRSAFGKLKDRVTGRKRGDVESSSAIVPGRYAALSGTLGQPFGGEVGGVMESRDVEISEEKRSKMKDLFKGRLRKSSDTRSCSSLASDSSMSSMASDNPLPPPTLDLLSDPPSSPIYTSKVRMDTHYGETDLAKKALTSQHTTKVLTHKRAFSDEASKIVTSVPRPLESVKGQTMTQSKSSLCINGSHIYNSEPSTPKNSGAFSSKLILLEKCSPLSRSLQNLTKRGDDKACFAEGRRWSFDKTKKEEKEEKEGQASSPSVERAQAAGPPMQAAMPAPSSVALSPDKGRKLRKGLFSGGRSDSLPAKSDLNQTASASEGRLRGWFGSSDSQNKPRLEVSPKVESSSDVPPPIPPHSPVLPQCSSPSAFHTGHVSPQNGNHTNPFTPSSSPSSNSISPSNPFFPHMQHNPFFEELIAEESQRSPPFTSCSPSGSSPFSYPTPPSHPCMPSSGHDVNAKSLACIKRERPRPVARQISLPALLRRQATPAHPTHTTTRSFSESAGEGDDSFVAFASSRLHTPQGTVSNKQPRSGSVSSHRLSSYTNSLLQELQKSEQEPPPLPPRRLLKSTVNEIYSDGWLHRGQELAVHKEACLLSQTGAASLQHGRNMCSVSPELQSSSETSDSPSICSESHKSLTSPECISEEKLKKFKYEPLEDVTDCWGGMLFEEDLYGRIGRVNYGQPKVKVDLLSTNTKERAVNKNIHKNCDSSQKADMTGLKMLLSSDISVSDLLSMSFETRPKSDGMTLGGTPAKLEQTTETNCVNNNVSSTLTVDNLNTNISNLDFSFIDSEGSSQSEVDDALKGFNALEGSRIAVLPEEKVPTSDDMSSSMDGYIPEKTSAFKQTTSSDNLCRDSSVYQDNCRDCQHKVNNVEPLDNSEVNRNDDVPLFSQTPNGPNIESGSRECRTGGAVKPQGDFDNNSNPDVQLAIANQTESLSKVVSARLRPKAMIRGNCSNGSNKKSRSDKIEEAEFDQLRSLVQNTSEVSEGPQISQSALSTLMALDKQEYSLVDNIHVFSSLEADAHTKLTENLVTEKLPEDNFEGLHAKVAPNVRTPSKIEQSLQVPKPSSAIPSVLSLPADCDAQAKVHLTAVRCHPAHPSSMGLSAEASPTLSVLPYTSSSSYSTTSTSDQLLVDARHSLLPEETQPANNLPLQESSQSEKKESRSVLEKLKSTIHPGRCTQQPAAEPDKSQEVTVDNSEQYQHLTNMELISLLLQQEMDMQKQRAASERQEAQLEKCEAELKKVKLQVRDLEDYIDNLLLRIMEQTPTLLQVRSRHK
ncbi:rab11 family-interacting protein 1-like isoform X2 [Thalassophryne amazonica]|uniref:rab11 family-interacting protein 1-like isoform X2 n=1 Tax=Thalassophryne amazonica TaxID=390379 RepID=UPI001470FD73|nr:rab11 family-interacting protein 1-like isoform X2 [Thalassophryne amazonica]